MSTKSVIMVHLSDREWTLEALHCASLLARNTSATLALVKLVPVEHLGWLGTEFGYMNFTHQEQTEFADFQATVEDYGIEFTPVLFQYMTLVEGIAQAAGYVDAQKVFAHVPASIIPFWTRFQRWQLKRQLARQNRQWIEYPVYDAGPSGPIRQAVAEINYH
jgi:hypothetical protein